MMPDTLIYSELSVNWFQPTESPQKRGLNKKDYQ